MNQMLKDNQGTPRVDWEKNKRVTITLSERDNILYSQRGLDAAGFRGDILDQRTKKRYHLYGASCGLPTCYCDAVIRPATEPIVRRGW